MTFLEFEKYHEELMKDAIRLKDTKGKEYANSENRFANFDRLSVRLRLPNLQIALVLLTKHMDAIESYIANGRTYSTEPIRGRIIDAINYLTLIGGMIAEKEEVKAKIVASNLDRQICPICNKEFKAGEFAGLNSKGECVHYSCTL